MGRFSFIFRSLRNDDAGGGATSVSIQRASHSVPEPTDCQGVHNPLCYPVRPGERSFRDLFVSNAIQRTGGLNADCETDLMGNLYHWLIFFGGVAGSVVLILYGLISKKRSVVVLVLLTGIFFVSVYCIVLSQKIMRPIPLTLFWLVGSFVGAIRQLRQRP